MPNLVTARPGFRRHLPPLLLMLSLAALVIALARPQRTVAAPERAATVMMVTDVSRLDERHRRRAEPPHRGGPLRQPAHRRAARDVPARPRHVLRLRRAARRALDRPHRASRRAGPADRGRRHRDGPRARARPRGGAHRRARRERAPAPAGSPPCSCCSPTARTRRAASTRSRSPERARDAKIPIFAIALGTPDGEVEVQDSFGGTTRIQVPPDTETLKDIARDQPRPLLRGRRQRPARGDLRRPRHPPLLARGQGGGHRGVCRRRALPHAGGRRALDGLVRPPGLTPRPATRGRRPRRRTGPARPRT